MSNDYGDGVSRVLDPTATQYLSVVWQEGAPPCDAEYTLMQDIAAGRLSQSTLAGSPSGWLGNEVNFSKDFVTDPAWSNWFKFGLQASSDQQSVMWAAVNGWLIPVTGTRTGLPPGSADNSDTWNKILLDPPPGSAGDARADFVFLEVWKARIAPNPSTLNKPNAASIYRYGNVEGGFSYLPDDLVDVAIGETTTERIQLQYRIRVVKGLVNLSGNPDGFDPTVVRAQGSQATPPSVGGYTFTNMKSLLGDPGLWRAGDGTENNLGTVDGYVYAVPICVIFRRNSSDWAGNPSPNLNGSFNRNTAAVDRNGAETFAPITLNTVMTAGTTYSSINLTTTSVMPSTGTIKIGDEILTYNGVSGSTLNLITRAQFGTVATDSHSIGDTVELLSGRPDGLFADQVTNTDILDLRHAVNPGGFDHQSLLLSNLDKLFKGQLRSNWKRSGTDPRGSFVFYEDLISASPPAIAGVTALDAPDHFRLAFSDAAIQQPLEVICRPVQSGPTFPITTQNPLPSSLAEWDMAVAANTLKQQTAFIWTSETSDGDGTGDQIQIPITQFQTQSLPGIDVDQVRFLNEVPVSSSTGTATGTTQFVDANLDFSKVVSPGDTIVIFVGVAKGSYVVASVTASVLSIDPTKSTSSTIPAAYPVTYIIRRGAGSVQLRLEGTSTNLPQHRFDVTPYNPGPTDPLVIRFIGAGAPFPTPSTDFVGSSRFYITTHLQYGGGRGLSRRPDTIHNIVLYNPTDGYLTKLVNYPSHDYPLSTAWAALWSKFRNAPYKGLLPVTADAYADLGSKTVILTPFQKISFPSNTHFLTAGSTIMPASEGSPGTPDPLSLFNHTAYVTLPRHLISGWGAVHVPIRAIDDTNFDQGINFMLTSKKGDAVGGIDLDYNRTYINYQASSVSCAIFSTNNLSNLSVAIPYNTALSFNGYSYAGIRLFNDDPTAVGALSTARGMGRQGIELPPYYGIARLFGVYEADDYATRGSAFSVTSHGDRRARSGGADNLLRQDFEGPAFWIELDTQGASTFVLSSGVIDITKSTIHPITSFSTGKYVIEANVFGFGNGSFDLTQQFQLALSSLTSTSGLTVQPPNTIIPAPVRINDSVLINYSRTPYQGDPWGSQTAFSDVQYLEGPLSSATAFELASTDLTGTLTRPNQKPLEILASVGFITSLGTGRLSGDFVQPNIYDFRNVGYEDPTGPNPYPPPLSSSPRPITKTGAIGSSPIFGDLEASPEYLGCTTRLPLGALYRDKDFKGGRFSDDFASPLVYSSNTGVGSGVAGLGGSTTLDQSEVLATPASVSSGVPGDVLIHVDGEQSNYNLLTNFRTARGGSIFVGSGDHPGGELFATYERVQGSVNGTRTLVGRAFLVRNAPTMVSGNQVSAGDELMLAVATQVMEVGTTPSEALILLGTNGSGEGYSAADLYRIEGHPLLANHTFYNVDPSTVVLPVGKTISQIVDPPDIVPFPMGAPNTVYASNGRYNFWSNAPTLTSLFLTNDLQVGGTVTLTHAPYSNITTPTASSGTTDGIHIVTGAATGTADTGGITINPGTSSGTGNAGPLLLEGGIAAGPSGNGGIATLAGGNAVSASGNGGNVSIRGGISLFSGTGGSVSINAGSGIPTNGSVSIGIDNVDTFATFNNLDLILGPTGAGNYGIQFTAVTTNPTIGQATALTGFGANLTIQSQIAAPGNNNGGDLRIIAGYGTGSGTGGSVSINAGSGTPTNGSVSIGIDNVDTFATFNNLDLILGPTGAGNYGIQFTAVTTNPTIGQATALTGFGANLTIQSQIAAPGNNNGGDLRIIAGYGTGSGTTGRVYISNGFRANLTVNSSDLESTFFDHNTTELGDGFSNDVYSLTFSSRVIAPKIGQKPVNGSGETLTIKAADVASVFLGDGGNLALFAGNAIGNVSQHHTGGSIYLKAGVGSYGSYGQVVIQIENGSTMSPAPVNVATFDQEAAVINVNHLDFDPLVGTAHITQQDATAGQNGNFLLIQAQKGDQTAGSTHDGGHLILNSGNHGPSGGSNGQVAVQIGGHGYTRAAFDETGLGINQTELSGTDSALGLDTSTNDPPVHPSATQHALYVNLQGQLRVDIAGRGSSTLNGTVARIVDTGAFTASPVTSSSPVNLLGVPGPTFTGVQEGDIIEGSALVHITAAHSASGIATFYLIIIDAGAVDITTCSISLGAATGIDQTITVPFSYTATSGTSGTIEFRPEAASSDGATAVTVSKPNSNNKWLYAKHTRP